MKLSKIIEVIEWVHPMRQSNLKIVLDFLLEPAAKNLLGSEHLPGNTGRLLTNYRSEGVSEDYFSAVPSETTTEERMYLYNFFTELWSGQANVIEVGPYIGGTSRPIALGMLHNPKRQTNTGLFTYDPFVYRRGDDLLSFVEPLFQSKAISDAYRQTLLDSPDVFELYQLIHQKEEYWPLITQTRALLPLTKEEDGSTETQLVFDHSRKYDAFFTDGCKRWYAMKYYMKHLVEQASPGSYFLFQDYGWPTTFYIALFMEVFSDSFELHSFANSTYAFKLIRSLSASTIEQRFPDSGQTVQPQEFRTAYELLTTKAMRREDLRAVLVHQLQYPVALAYLNRIDEAREQLQIVEGQPYAGIWQNIVRAARARIDQFSGELRPKLIP